MDQSAADISNYIFIPNNGSNTTISNKNGRALTTDVPADPSVSGLLNMNKQRVAYTMDAAVESANGALADVSEYSQVGPHATGQSFGKTPQGTMSSNSMMPKELLKI